MIEWPPSGFPSDRGSVVTVGTFDGVHQGHLSVLREICRRAEVSGRRSVVVTFDPHPLKVVRPEHAPRLLTTPIEKKEALVQCGVEWAVFLRFTETLGQYEPEQFVREILVDRLRVEELVIGHDHGFGRGRSGDAETLRAVGRDAGFTVDVVTALSHGEEPVSSTAIRRAVELGELDAVEAGLGRPYELSGDVVSGDGRGRELGFPTANLTVDHPDKLVPGEGVYAITAWTGEGVFLGALHIGPRPVFPGAAPSIEVHLLDFDGSLYGSRIRIRFERRLRDVANFPSVDDLIEQIARDVEEVRRFVPLHDGAHR